MKSETLRVRVAPEVKTWLRRKAAKQGCDISDIVRALLLPAFNARHSK